MDDSSLSVVRRVCKEKVDNIILKLSAVNSLLEGNDVLAILPIGFGKCYFQGFC